MAISVPLIVQLSALIVGTFGVIASLLILLQRPDTVTGWIRGIFALFFSFVLIEIEFYVFGIHRYFGFLLKNWGKALMYLFVGALLFQMSGYGLWCAVVYWGLALIFGIIGIFVPIAQRPVLQGGIWGSTVDLELSIRSTDIFKSET
jgi:hypothetical protein